MPSRAQKRKIWDPRRMSEAVVAKEVILCHWVTFQSLAGKNKQRLSQRLPFLRISEQCCEPIFVRLLRVGMDVTLSGTP